MNPSRASTPQYTSHINATLFNYTLKYKTFLQENRERQSRQTNDSLTAHKGTPLPLNPAHGRLSLPFCRKPGCHLRNICFNVECYSAKYSFILRNTSFLPSSSLIMPLRDGVDEMNRLRCWGGAGRVNYFVLRVIVNIS